MVEKVNALMKRIERELEIHGDKPLDIEKLSSTATLDIISGKIYMFFYIYWYAITFGDFVIMYGNEITTTIGI